MNELITRKKHINTLSKEKTLNWPKHTTKDTKIAKIVEY